MGNKSLAIFINVKENLRFLFLDEHTTCLSRSNSTEPVVNAVVVSLT